MLPTYQPASADEGSHSLDPVSAFAATGPPTETEHGEDEQTFKLASDAEKTPCPLRSSCPPLEHWEVMQHLIDVHKVGVYSFNDDVGRVEIDTPIPLLRPANKKHAEGGKRLCAGLLLRDSHGTVFLWTADTRYRADGEVQFSAALQLLAHNGCRWRSDSSHRRQQQNCEGDRCQRERGCDRKNKKKREERELGATSVEKSSSVRDRADDEESGPPPPCASSSCSSSAGAKYALFVGIDKGGVVPPELQWRGESVVCCCNRGVAETAMRAEEEKTVGVNHDGNELSRQPAAASGSSSGGGSSDRGEEDVSSSSAATRGVSQSADEDDSYSSASFCSFCCRCPPICNHDTLASHRQAVTALWPSHTGVFKTEGDDLAKARVTVLVSFERRGEEEG